MLGVVALFLYLLSTLSLGLVPDFCVSQLAQRRAEQLASGASFKHDSYVLDRIETCSYNYCYYGELLGKTTGGPEGIWNEFLASEPHYRLLQQRKWDAVGIGVSQNTGGEVFVVLGLVGNCEKITWRQYPELNLRTGQIEIWETDDRGNFHQVG